MIKSFLRFLRLRRLLKVERELAMEKAELATMKSFVPIDERRGLPTWFVSDRIRLAGRIAALECEKKQLEELLGIEPSKK